MATVFDELMDFERVQAFLRRYPTKTPGIVANNFLELIRGGRELTPEGVLVRLVMRDKEHAEVIWKHVDDARYVAEYYMVWARLPKKEKDTIQRARWE